MTDSENLARLVEVFEATKSVPGWQQEWLLGYCVRLEREVVELRRHLNPPPRMAERLRIHAGSVPLLPGVQVSPRVLRDRWELVPSRSESWDELARDGDLHGEDGWDCVEDFDPDDDEDGPA